MTTEQENTLANLGEWHNTTPQVTEHPSGTVVARFVKPGVTFTYAIPKSGEVLARPTDDQDDMLAEWIEHFERKQRSRGSWTKAERR